MPVRRDADGNIIEEETERADSFGQEAQPDEETAPMRPEGSRQPTFDDDPQVNIPQQSGYEARTVVAQSKSAGDPAQAVPVEETAPADPDPERHTRIYRPGARKSPASERPPEQPAGQGEATLASDAMEDPPVGWLVVVQGPGQGNAVTIGNGSNAIGRDPSERICLDFGDTLISRQRHALITYDPKGRKFYVQQGDGKNLTYLGDAPVLMPTELEGFSTIQMGETVLLFVPLCGERFDWAEYAG